MATATGEKERKNSAWKAQQCYRSNTVPWSATCLGPSSDARIHLGLQPLLRSVLGRQDPTTLNPQQPAGAPSPDMVVRGTHPPSQQRWLVGFSSRDSSVLMVFPPHLDITTTWVFIQGLFSSHGFPHIGQHHVVSTCNSERLHFSHSPILSWIDASPSRLVWTHWADVCGDDYVRTATCTRSSRPI